MSQNKQQFILVDGSSYLFRAYHAMPELTNDQGEHTGAIYGVINMIRKLLKDYDPKYIGVVFDAKGKTFRHDMYAEYKANRPAMPDDLREQIQPIHDIIQAMGLPLLVHEGVEADDVIGTLARKAEQHGWQTIISTGDKDMAQLVSDNITLLNTMNKPDQQVTDVDGVMTKFGVKPEQIIDYLALMGDKVDNIPGVPKVGPKTAAKWLAEYDTLENLIENAEQIKGKVGESLRDSLEQLPLSKDLTTIACELDIDCTPESLAFQAADTQKLMELYKKYNFRTWYREVSENSDDDSVVAKDLVETNYEIILTQQQFNQWYQKLEQAELIAIDTETTSLNTMDAELVGISFSVNAHEAAYLPVAHDYIDAPEQLDRDMVLQKLKPLLESKQHKKVGQNLKYDYQIFKNHGITLQGIAYDTMLESYVNNSVANRHDMDTLAAKYLDHETTHFEDIAGKGKKQLSFNQIEIEKAGHYAAEDADITLQLHQYFYTELSKHTSLLDLLNEIEMPLLTVLAETEITGVKIDAKLLQQQSLEIAERLQAITKEVYDLAGEEFNLSSPKQLQSILFDEDKMNLPVIKKTPKGQPSTAEEVLQELALDYPLPKLLLEHRGLSKLKSTYTDKLPLEINSKTGRVHTSYHQAVAATGRLSSQNPNLQNIPIKNEQGRRVRQAFIAEADYKIVAADYSQIELRIMAHLSQDEGLLDAFAKGLDIHSATAAEVFNIAIDDVKAEQRRRAKAINFGLIYGMSAFGLAKQLGIERDEAQQYIHTYFSRYPGVENYMQAIREQAHEQGYVSTIFGRRLYLPNIKSKNGLLRKAAERTAINAPMQGSAADIIKLAMIKVFDWIQTERSDIKMIMQVHDELVFEIPQKTVKQDSQTIIELMQDTVKLDVPLVVDAGIGDNWDEAH